jgi:hypothetical protein
MARSWAGINQEIGVARCGSLGAARPSPPSPAVVAPSSGSLDPIALSLAAAAIVAVFRFRPGTLPTPRRWTTASLLPSAAGLTA